MLMIRLVFALLVIAAVVLLGFYLFTNNKKYLQYLKTTLKYTLYLVLITAVLFVIRRFLYV
jgi:hypothetical protein